MWGIEMRFVCALRAGLWHVTLYGDFEIEAAKRAYSEILGACTDGGPCRLLLDARMVDGRPTIVDRYEFGEHVARENDAFQESGRVATLQVALVCETPLLDARRFAQTVATNRGAWVLATERMDEAMRWLGAAASGEPSLAGV